jgi:hypothetical protein
MSFLLRALLVTVLFIALVVNAFPRVGVREIVADADRWDEE